MIHPTAIISPKAVLGHNVSIGAFTIIYDHVVIEDNTIIGSHCELGYPTSLSNGSPLLIGHSSLIRSHSIFYEGSCFGEGLITGHRVTVREKTKAGKYLQLGTLTDVQGTCEFGNYVRLHSNVHIGQHSHIGHYVWIFPYVVLTNDPHPPSHLMMGVTIQDFAVLATMSLILPGVTVGTGSLVAAHSTVSKNVPDDVVVAGSPAKTLFETNKIKLKNEPETSAYPWRRHFHRGYPSDVVDLWIKEFS